MTLSLTMNETLKWQPSGGDTVSLGMVPLSSTWDLSDGDPSYLKLTTGMKS